MKSFAAENIDNEYRRRKYMEEKQKRKNPKVTVGIPVYNQRELVIRALDSIPKRADIEIIVVDDGSDDGTWDSLIEYQKTRDFILLNNQINMGVAHTVNKIYDNAKGDYIVLLGSDDYFYTDKFEECMKRLDGTDLVYFDMQINNGDIWEINNDSKTVLCGSVKFMRKNFIGKTRCPEDKKSGEDKPFYEELLSKNPTEKFTHIVVKHYNHPRENSLTDLVRKGILDV